jgi:signal transduction histidine kinase
MIGHPRAILLRATGALTRRPNIAWQIRLAFTVGGSFLIVVGLASALLARVLTGALDQTVRDVGVGQSAISAMRDAIATENAGVQGYLITGEPAQLQQVEQGHSAFASASARLAAQSPAARAILADLRALEAAFYALGQREIVRGSTGGAESAAVEWQSAGGSALQVLRTRLDDLASDNFRAMQQRLDHARAVEFWTRVLGAPLIALVAGAGCFFAFYASTRLSRRFRALEEDVARIEAGVFDLGPARAGNDELVRLSRSLRQMAATLEADKREREALLTERARANERISALYDMAITLNQSLDPDEVLRLALDKLLTYTGMNVASVYLIDERTGQFTLTMALNSTQMTAAAREQAAAASKDAEDSFAEFAGHLDSEEMQRILHFIAARDRLTRLALPRLPRYHGPYRTAIAIPLRSKGRELGILGLASYEDLTPTDDAAQLMEALARQLGTALEHARLAAQSRRLAVSEERNRIARDLHDSVTQMLFSISLMAQALPSLIERQPERAVERAQRLADLSRGALAEMRMLILELRPAMLREVGLPMALQRYVEGWSSREEIAAGVRVEGLQRRLLPEHEEALFRVAQEALANVAKHARASHAEIVLDFSPNSVSLTVDDNGIGIAQPLPGGFGLASMRERIAALRGTLAIEPRPDGGTRVQARVPAPAPTTSITA